MTTKAVSVTEFKAHCLDVIRQVEQAGTTVDLVRRGRVVARLVPTAPAARERNELDRLAAGHARRQHPPFARRQNLEVLTASTAPAAA